MGAGHRPTPDGIISEQGDERPRDACRRRGGATVPAATQVRRRTFAPAFSPTWRRKSHGCNDDSSDHRPWAECKRDKDTDACGLDWRFCRMQRTASRQQLQTNQQLQTTSEEVEAMTTSREISTE